MNHIQFFIASLINPKQLAATRVLSIGKVIQYAFILITLLSIFSFGQFTTGMSSETFDIEGLEDYLADIQWLIYPFAFLFIFLMMAAFTFLRITLYAVVGQAFVRLLKRRGEYRQIWRTATYTMTWATLLSIFAEMFQLPGTVVTLVGIVITISFLYIAITRYPKQKN